MKYIIVILFGALLSTAGYGQKKGDRFAYTNWSFGPTINKKFVNQFSAGGANIGFSTFIKDNLAVGAEIGWGNYSEYFSQATYKEYDGAFTTDMYRTLFTLPLTLTATKYFEASKTILPYAKIGVGALYSKQSLFYNVYETEKSNWGFVAYPELGANIKLNAYNPWAFNISSQYKVSTNKNEQFYMKNIQTLHFNLGVTWQIGRRF